MGCDDSAHQRTRPPVTKGAENVVLILDRKCMQWSTDS